jgi:hypothetical protein
MGVRSDPARALHKMVRIPRIAALKDHFNAAEHLSRTPGIDDFTAGDLNLDAEVAFDSCYWINDISFSHILSSLKKKD